MEKDYIQEHLARRKALDAENIRLMQYRNEKHYLKDYHFFSANIQAFLPEIPLSEHPKAYLDHCKYRNYASLDIYYQYYYSSIKTNILGNTSVLSTAPKKPYIFCTFHLGAYRGLLNELKRSGYDLSLIVDKRTYDELVEKQSGDWKNHIGDGLGFELLDAERFEVMIQLIQRLRSGKSAVAYLDGNTGTGGVHRHDDKLTKIDFLAQTIYARKGIAHISYISQVPIIPVISFYDENDQMNLFFGEEIPVNKQVSAEIFAHDTTQYLYDFFTPFLRKYYEQWEAWVYVHKYIDHDSLQDATEPTALNINGNLTFNAERYSIFKLSEEACFLLDKKMYKTYPINNHTFNSLLSMQNEACAVEKIMQAMNIETYWKKKIFVEAA